MRASAQCWFEDNDMNTFELDKEYIAQTYGRFPVEITGGQGSLLYGSGGKEYIDMGAGIAVNTFGVCDKEWIAAVTEQLGKFQHTSNLYYTEPCARLAEQLCLRTGMKKVFFSNSGAEANECAIKAARAWSERVNGAGCSTVITLKNSFHGRTLTTLAATGQDKFHDDFTPLTPGFVYAEANNFESVKKLAEENKCAAVMLETIQGEGGVNVLTNDFVLSVYEYVNSHNMLLIIDEVQTGNGRTGMLYSYMNYNIKPDIFSTAKGLGGGLPLGATLLGERTADVFAPGMHGSTFGGNPVCCAGALSVLSRIDDKLFDGVNKKSLYVYDMLSGAEGVGNITGVGLMLGIEPTKRTASEIVNACIERGVLTLTAKNKVRLLPALNIPDELLEKAVSILKEELAK